MPKYKKSRGLSKRQKQDVKRLVNTTMEKKYYDTEGQNTVTNTGTILSFSAPAQGDGVLQRIGDQIQPYSFEITYGITYADTTNYMRVLLVQWKPDTALEAPTVAEVFEASGVNPPFTPIKQDNRHKMRVLYDVIHAVGSGGTGCLVRKVRLNQNQMLKSIRFNEAAATGSNKIYAILLSDSGAIADPAFNYSTLLRYTDA